MPRQMRSGTSHYFLTCQLRLRIPKSFETMMEEMIDIFRNTTPAVNQKFVRKIHIETSTRHTVSMRKRIRQSRLLGRELFCPMFRKFSQLTMRK